MAWFRGIADKLHDRDPSHDGLRRALRAGLVVPFAAVASFLIAGNSQAPIFTFLGAIAMLIVADFPGAGPTRAMAFCWLGVNGAVLLTLGTLAAPHPWLAVPLCFAVGASVSFLGLLSEVLAASQSATFMVFLLSVCIPPGPLGPRLLGWLLALVICVPAALFLFPTRHTSGLRQLAAEVCTALADRIDGVIDDDQLTGAMEALRTEFLSNAFRPVALSAGSRSLIRIVPNLQWLSDRVGPETGALLGPIEPDSVRVLRASADVLRSGDAAAADQLATVVAEHKSTAFGQFATDIRQILEEPDDNDAVRRGDVLLNRRTISAAIGLTGRIIVAATAIDARPITDRLFGRGMPETGIADRVHSNRRALAALPGYLRTRSITVLNSLRTGTVLALAVIVTLVLPVQNGLWVVLGALSVLRSSAATTRTSVVRAVTGTVVGFCIGVVVITLVGTNTTLLWILLPLATFGSAYVLKVGSFTASQAMFTMQVLIVMNIISPVGWRIGLIRIEDVLLGAAVGLVASALLWPGGAQAAVQSAIDQAVQACSRYLAAAVDRVTKGDSPETRSTLAHFGSDALTATRTYGDALRVYLAETGGTIESSLLDTANRIPRLRSAADLIADIKPPAAESFPRTKDILQAHTSALCARLDGTDPTIVSPAISEDFVLMLRAETRQSGAPTDAALPLLTAAANIGELELTYPAVTEEAQPSTS